MTESPFTLARFEYEQDHLYFLQKRLFARLETPKPVYLVGSRGTGKTTLLKALSWSERLNNKSLARQIKGRRTRYIGVYLKLPEIQLGLVSRWASAAGEGVHANIFSHYLDLVWLEELLRAISELAVAGRLNVSAERERDCVEEIVASCDASLEDGDGPPRTLREFARVLKRRREAIEMCASTSVNTALAVERLRLISHVGAFGREIADQLGRLCNAGDDTQDAAGPGWTFKICMDEGECLDSFQQRVVNSMLRLSKAPLFFVVSFVSSPVDPTTTVLTNLSLQQADRELVPLDEISEREFRELVEGVATVRIKHITDDNDAAFYAKKVLGELDINGLLVGILRESVSPAARKLLADAELAGKEARSRQSKRGTDGESLQTSPPIYQTYLTQQRGLDSSGRGSDVSWKRRRQDSAELRKRIVAAYLAICDDIHADPRYASADIVLQTSDNCVRDFLAQLDEIFHLANVPLSRFLNGPIDVKTQDQAIKTASSKKYASLPMFGVNNPTETRALVDGLAKLTALLQKRSATGRHLKSSERGRFVVTFDGSPQDEHSQLLQSLREAAEAGFLRLLSTSTKPLTFRVHTSLAPKYGFSYRGAYYNVPLEWRVLDEMRIIKEARELDEFVTKLYGKLEGTETQSDLFSGSMNE